MQSCQYALHACRLSKSVHLCMDACCGRDVTVRWMWQRICHYWADGQIRSDHIRLHLFQPHQADHISDAELCHKAQMLQGSRLSCKPSCQQQQQHPGWAADVEPSARSLSAASRCVKDSHQSQAQRHSTQIIIMTDRMSMSPGSKEPDLGVHLSLCKVEYGPCRRNCSLKVR